MDAAQIARKITEQLLANARQRPDRVEYIARATARLLTLEQFPPADVTTALLEFGAEFGLLAPEATKEN